MRHRTLEDYIGTLSEDEKEQHKLLIEECRQRGSKNTNNYKGSMKTLAKLLIDAVRHFVRPCEKFPRSLN